MKMSEEEEEEEESELFNVRLDTVSSGREPYYLHFFFFLFVFLFFSPKKCLTCNNACVL